MLELVRLAGATQIHRLTRKDQAGHVEYWKAQCGESRMLRLGGRIWQAQGNFEDAQPCFEHSLAGLLAINDVVEHARTEEAYGLFYIARDKEGDMQRGQALLKSAQATFKRLGVNG